MVALKERSRIAMQERLLAPLPHLSPLPLEPAQTLLLPLPAHLGVGYRASQPRLLLLVVGAVA